MALSLVIQVSIAHFWYLYSTKHIEYNFCFLCKSQIIINVTNIFLLIELIPIEMKDDNVTMYETISLYDGDLIPDLDRSLDNCGSMSIFLFHTIALPFNPLFNY